MLLLVVVLPLLPLRAGARAAGAGCGLVSWAPFETERRATCDVATVLWTLARKLGWVVIRWLGSMAA